MKRVSVFGGSKPKPGEPDYEQALRLGSLLGAGGFTVLTGGYIGTMEAVSRGAAEAGGHVVGVTCDEIEAWRPGKHNPWVLEERRYGTLRERLSALIDGCDAALALPGGPGTLTEISLTWNLLVTDAITPRPLILIGAGWQQTFECYFSALSEYVPPAQRRWLSFAPDVEASYEQLAKMLA